MSSEFGLAKADGLAFDLGLKAYYYQRLCLLPRNLPLIYADAYHDIQSRWGLNVPAILPEYFGYLDDPLGICLL